MADQCVTESKYREILKNLMDELSNGLQELDSNILPKAKALKKTIALLIDQSASVNCALVDKDFLDEFCDTNMKGRIQAKIYNCIEEEVLKLRHIVDEFGAEIMKYRSMLTSLKALTPDSITFECDSKETIVNLLNAFEWAGDCVQLYSFLHINFQIAVVCISYDDTTSLKKLECALNEVKKVKKIIFEKRKSIMDLLTPFSSEEVNLIIIPEHR